MTFHINWCKWLNICVTVLFAVIKLQIWVWSFISLLVHSAASLIHDIYLFTFNYHVPLMYKQFIATLFSKLLFLTLFLPLQRLVVCFTEEITGTLFRRHHSFTVFCTVFRRHHSFTVFCTVFRRHHSFTVFCRHFIYFFFIPSSSGSAWLLVNPPGIRKLLVWIKNHYGDLSIYVTENGISDRNGTLEDWHRIYYYKHYINNVLKGNLACLLDAD